MIRPLRTTNKISRSYVYPQRPSKHRVVQRNQLIR